MARSERGDWLTATITLTAAWAAITVALVAITIVTNVALPAFIAKAGPFFLAGFISGRWLSLSATRPKIIAVLVLAIVASVAWTAFTFATTDLGASKALVLLAVSLPVMLLASLWAYFGMFLGGHREAPTSADGFQGDPEHDELERELRNEIAEVRRRAQDA